MEEKAKQLLGVRILGCTVLLCLLLAVVEDMTGKPVSSFVTGVGMSALTALCTLLKPAESSKPPPE